MYGYFLVLIIFIYVLYELYIGMEPDSDCKEFLDKHRKLLDEIDKIYKRDWK